MSALDDTIRGAAAVLVDAGFAVFPVRGKVPLTSRGCLDATRDYDQLDAWFARWPDAGVGIATGAPSRSWVLDVDGERGAASLRVLEDVHGALPATVAARTARGAHHYWRLPARCDVRCSAGRVAPGLDVRGTGGYVVAPPSRHPSGGRYSWLADPHVVEMVAAPDWLLQLATRPAPTAAAPVVASLGSVRFPLHRREYVRRAIIAEAERVALASEGTRNETLHRAAYALGRLVADGSARGEHVERALEIAASHAGLGAAEIHATIRSAWRARGCA